MGNPGRGHAAAVREEGRPACRATEWLSPSGMARNRRFPGGACMPGSCIPALEWKRPFRANAGTAFMMMNGRKLFRYRIGLMNRGIRPPATRKMEKAASMTPEMTGTWMGSMPSSGLSQYMERMTLK